ncbi:kelch repeat-containing protein [Niabella sp.]|uniref:kelch repeat-containing protein n=1 Tax=Niabella sp. TaxID=1962976 RepID=UPI00260FB064|nr:kelch repeat-containing protein [Niabella sp.]
MSMQWVACHPPHNHKTVFQWKQFAVLPSSEGTASLGYAGPVTGIQGNRLLIGGGANFPGGMPWTGGKKQYYSQAYVTDINEKVPIFRTFSLPYAVAYSANCNTPSGIICAGGETDKGPLSQVLRTQFDKDVPVCTALPALPLALTNAAATAVGNHIYVAGGETGNAVSSRFFRLDLEDTLKGWQALPDIPHPASHAVLVALPEDGKIFLAGGRRKMQNGISTLYKDLFEYDIAGGRWTAKKNLPYALSAGTGAVIKNRYIALFGGDKGTVFHKTELLISAIEQEQDPATKQALIKEKNRVQETHPGFSNEILLYDIKDDRWAAAGSIPGNIPVTTTAVKSGNRVWLPSGEIKAGVRSPFILEATIRK